MPFSVKSSKLPSAQPRAISGPPLAAVAGGDQRFAQPDAADAGIGLAAVEPGDDLRRRHAGCPEGRHDRRFGPGLQRALERPGGRDLHHRVDIGEFGAAVAVQGIAPLQQLARGGVLALVAQRQRACSSRPWRRRRRRG